MLLYDDPVPLADTAVLDASIADADWPLIQALWRAGWTNAGIYRLLRFRVRLRHRPSGDHPVMPQHRPRAALG
jgi:hypothetical protein